MTRFLILLLTTVCLNAQEFIPFLGATVTGNNLLNGLVAFWRFEENTDGDALDSSGNSRTLTANSSIITSANPGVVGLDRDYSVSDLTDYFYRTSEPALTFNTNTAFTITAWALFNPDADPVINDMTILSKADIFSDKCSWWLELDHASPDDKIAFYYSETGTQSDFLSHPLTYDFFGPVSAGTWIFVCVRWDGATISLSATEIGESAVNTPVTVAFLGPFYNSSTIPFLATVLYNDTVHDLEGNIDEVGIWDVYLSDCQVEKLFSAKGGTFTYTSFDSNPCSP